MEKVTCDTIMSWLKNQTENKQPVDSHTWIEACQKLNVLIGDEHDKLLDLQQEVAKLKILRIESGDSVAKARTYVESTDEYKAMKRQEARIEQITESIRISKIMSRLKNEEMGNY